MSIDRIRYELRVMGMRIILTPILTMLGFALLAELMHSIHADTTRTAQVLMAGLEMMLPLAAGVIVATVSTQDAAIELQLTMPGQYSTTTFRRLTVIIGWTTGIALLSSSIIYALKLWRIPLQLQSWSASLQFITGQLAWIAPMLWFVAIGLCLALLFRSRAVSGGLLGGIWLLETLAHDLFVTNTWLHPLFLFPTTLASGIDFWLVSRWELIGSAVVVLILGWLLLHNTEALLQTAQTGE